MRGLTSPNPTTETDAIFRRAHWRATRVLWIDIFVTIVILTGVVSRL
jgi:hypothetical protein